MRRGEIGLNRTKVWSLEGSKFELLTIGSICQFFACSNRIVHFTCRISTWMSLLVESNDEWNEQREFCDIKSNLEEKLTRTQFGVCTWSLKNTAIDRPNRSIFPSTVDFNPMGRCHRRTLFKCRRRWPIGLTRTTTFENRLPIKRTLERRKRHEWNSTQPTPELSLV